MNQKRPNIHIIKNTEGDITYEVHRRVKSIQKLRKLIHTKQEKEMKYKTTGTDDRELVKRYDYRVQISYKPNRITFTFDRIKETR